LSGLHHCIGCEGLHYWGSRIPDDALFGLIELVLSPPLNLLPGGDSWIDFFYSPHGEASSSVQNAQPGQQPQGPLPAPSITEVRWAIENFTSSLNRISMRSDILSSMFDELGIYTSSAAKRRQLIQFLEEIKNLPLGERPRSGKKAGDALAKLIREWEREQGQ
jgi:hypothetical protein